MLDPIFLVYLIILMLNERKRIWSDAIMKEGETKENTG